MDRSHETPRNPDTAEGPFDMRSPTAVSLLVLMIVIVLAFGLQLIRA